MPTSTLSVAKVNTDEQELSRRELRRLKGEAVIKGIIAKKGGELLSDNFTKYSDRITIQCEKGHIWSPIANDVKNGHWCSICGENQKYTIERLQLLVKGKYKGKLLDKEFKGMPYTHTFKCQKGHIFEKKARAVVFDNTWCPECSKVAKQKKIRESRFLEIKELVEEQGGTMVSKEFIRSTLKLTIKCKHGHELRKTSTEIRKGFTCPSCQAAEEVLALLD